MLLKSNKIISFLLEMVLCTHYLINDFIFVYRRWSHVFVLFVSEACFCEARVGF